MSFNLATMLRQSAQCVPDKPLLRCPDRDWTYAQIDEASNRLATWLRMQCFPTGAGVAVQLPNGAAFVVSYFGVLKAGLTLVPMAPMLSRRERTGLLNASKVVALVHGEDDQHAHISIEAQGWNDADTTDAGRGWLLLGDPLPPPIDPDIYPASGDDVAAVLYTSGTTGRPKGAELTHFQLYMACTVGTESLGTSSDEVMLAALPLFHVYGLCKILNAAVRYARSVSVVPRFSAAAVIKAIETHRVTIMAGVPTMYRDLAEFDITGRDISSVRIASCGGAPIPRAVLSRFEAKYQIALLEGYGLTESASTVIVNRSTSDRRVGSVGRPVWGVEVRVVDRDATVLPDGPDHVGELQLRGHNMIMRYRDDDEATTAAITNGWFATGDLGYCDDGFVYLVGRAKDLIIRGGYNVYPAEVENALCEHPAVSEAAVIGRPEDRLGEEVQAFVVLAAGQSAKGSELRDWAKERLAAYKYPREIYIVDQLPRGATGKVMKRQLQTPGPESPAHRPVPDLDSLDETHDASARTAATGRTEVPQ